MTVERRAHRSEKEFAKINEAIDSKILPVINRVFDNPIFEKINHNKLIAKLATAEETTSDFKEKMTADKSITKIFPYYDELVTLGVKPDIIESNFCNVSDDAPYDRDILNHPEQLNIPKDFPALFENPMIGMTALIATLDTLGLPEPREIKDQKMQYIARKAIKKHTNEVLLKEMIVKSGLNPEDTRFDNVKAVINQDLHAETTLFFFFGGQILGLLEGQNLDACAFSASEDLHKAAAYVLAEPVIKAVFDARKINPIEVNVFMRQFRENNKEALPLIKEHISIDLDRRPSLSEKDERLENYKVLLDLYINSQIPLIAMDRFFC